jgi:hypothetical protein
LGDFVCFTDRYIYVFDDHLDKVLSKRKIGRMKEVHGEKEELRVVIGKKEMRWVVLDLVLVRRGCYFLRSQFEMLRMFQTSLLSL